MEPKRKEIPRLPKVKSEYEGGECPDCQEEIPNDARHGEECMNCGHIWNEVREDD